MGFFAKGTFLPSRLPLTRELPSVSEAEGEKDYPSVTCGASSPDKGSQEREGIDFFALSVSFEMGGLMQPVLILPKRLQVS